MIPMEAVERAEAIIFDCDGTLVDSMPIHYLAWHETMTAYGLSLPEDRFYSLGGMPSNRIIEMLSREQRVTVDADRASQDKELAFLKRIEMLEPIQMVLEIAREFRGRKPIAVASGGYRQIVLRQLQQVQCADWFDAIVTAEDTTRHKPEPDVFLEAARRLATLAERCLVFEDADLGVEAAERAGMQCIDVRTFYTPKRIPLPRGT